MLSIDQPPERNAETWMNLANRWFADIRRVVAAGDPRDLQEEGRLLTEWEDYLRGLGERQEKEWTRYATMRALLWCASVALTSRSALDELSRPWFDQKPKPLSFAGRKFTNAWLFDCVRQLLPDDRAGRPPKPPPGVTPTLTVPVGLCEVNGLGIGTIVSLELELRAGAGEIFQHPGDTALKCYAAPTFSRAIANAWAASKHLAERHDCDARWRLALPESVREVEGNSAGGATARCCWYGLTGRLPDPEVIVLAAVNSTGRLGPVLGIPSKTKAIARDPTIDTIVVADANDAGRARRELQDEGVHDDRIRVVEVR